MTSPVGRPVDARLVARKELAPDIVSVWLEAKSITARIQPGQFVQVRIPATPTAYRLPPTAHRPGGQDPRSLTPDPFFLRRPFSVAQQHGNRIRIVFRITGRGTATLGQARPGDKWSLLGPLGKPAPQFNNREVVLVGGGIGIAPLLFLAERISRNNRVSVLLGARNRHELILCPEFRKIRVKLNLCTDDGSLGSRAHVTELLQSLVRSPQFAVRSSQSAVVFACGPRPMLQRVKELTEGLESYAFWEERMGCGTGICHGCAVKRAGGEGYLRFCQEGPVLRMSDIEL